MRFRKRAVLVNVPSFLSLVPGNIRMYHRSGFLVPGNIRFYSRSGFWCQGTSETTSKKDLQNLLIRLVVLLTGKIALRGYLLLLPSKMLRVGKIPSVPKLLHYSTLFLDS